MHEPSPPRAQRGPHVAAGEVSHDAADMSVTAAADVTLGDVQSRLADAGQWLALDGDPAATLGDLASNDSTGPLRLGYGGWRDLLTGVQYQDGRGDLVTVGGVTVKNVAGYDLVKFLIGSHGCFGSPVTLTLRTYRRPEAALAATLPREILDDLTSFLCGDAPPQWMLLTPDGLRAGWLGRSREIDRLAPLLPNVESRDLDADADERRRRLDVGSTVLRVAVAPADVAALVGQLQPSRFAADPVFGRVWIGLDDAATLPDVLAVVRSRGGDAILSDATGVLLLCVPPATRRVLASLKKSLDPHGRLPPLPIED